jgi:hypothetical protein
MSDIEAELREQFTEAFADAEYPITGQMDIVPALPDGPGTTFTAGEQTLSAMELASELSGHQDFPYEDVDSLVDDAITGLKSEDVI